MAPNKIAGVALACAGVIAGAAHAGGDATRGAELYSARCGACHSIEENGAGPRHLGLIGRRAGSQPEYDYSSALRSSRIVWTRRSLNQWLANPGELVPANKMVVQLANDPKDRADLIEYLSVATKVPISGR
ncbi:MAG TPA: c-type cytochrome [Steroidobacteraceae bacterium]|nr:c-type cytochrome [Steroidobacteraceae bacterium]